MTEFVRSLGVCSRVAYIHDSSTSMIQTIYEDYASPARALISIVLFACQKNLYNDSSQTLTFIQ